MGAGGVVVAASLASFIAGAGVAYGFVIVGNYLFGNQLDKLLKKYNMALESDQATIAKAFRKLSRALHPDKNPGKDTTAAYQELNSDFQTMKKLAQERLKASTSGTLAHASARNFILIWEELCSLIASHFTSEDIERRVAELLGEKALL